MGISIIGTGMYVPEKIINNTDMAKLVDTNDEWITTRTGISERHIAVDELTYQLGVKAAKEAILDAKIDPMTIDRVVATGVTCDYITPSMACLIANEVGAYNAAGIDINTACAGFVYALDIARRYLLDDDCETILVVSCESMSKIVDYTDRSTCVLFGDGAGACVVKHSDNDFFCHMGGDPKGTKHLFARGIFPDSPFLSEPFDSLRDGFEETVGHKIYQNGKEVYKFATKIMPLAVEEVCKKAGMEPHELDLIIPHQANLRIIETAAKNLHLPIENFFVNIQMYGNMSSACIPIGLHQAIRNGKVKKGDKICLVGFGAGLVYGALIFEI